MQHFGWELLLKIRKRFVPFVQCSSVWQRSVNVKLILVQVLTHHALWHIHQCFHEGWRYVGLLCFKQPIITICALAQVCTWHSVQFTCASTLNIIDFIFFLTGTVHKLIYCLWCWGKCYTFHLMWLSCHLLAMTCGRRNVTPTLSVWSQPSVPIPNLWH